MDNHVGPAFRVGIVQQQDPARARVRVIFPDRDQLLSYWLPVVSAKTQSDKAYFIPDLGEQVVCLMDGRDEAGAVLGAIYSTADAAPVDSSNKFHLSFKDGASFEYDRASHALSVNLPGGATFAMTANGASIAIDSSGDVKVVTGGTLTWSASAVSALAQTVALGTGGKGVARLGDAVQVKDDQGNTLSGTIVSASVTIEAQD